MTASRAIPSFAPGPGVAILAEHCLLLVEHRDDVHIDALWAAAESTEPLDRVLAELTRDGVRRAPSFVCVARVDGRTTVFVRGEGGVVATLTDGSTFEIRSVGVQTWVEERIDDAISFSARLTNETVAPAVWRAASGVLPAIAVHGWTAGSTVPDAVITMDAAPAPMLLPPQLEKPPADPFMTLLPIEDGPLRSSDGLIDSVPMGGIRAGAPPQVTARSNGVPDLDPNATLTSQQLQALLGQARAPEQPSSDGPSVHAVRCDAGHLNPPEADACRFCGSSIGSRSIVVVPRPSLGKLRFDTGNLVELTLPLLVGRKPPSNERVNGEVAVPVAIPDPEQMLSRVHLEVRLEGWQVLVVDRRSVNATFVTSPGKPPLQLRPAEPYPIVPGTTVSLGDIVSFVYEIERA